MTTEHHAGWARGLDETATLRAEVERLRDGGDFGPRDPATIASPAQMWAMLLEADAEARIRMLTHAGDAMDEAAKCFRMDHDRRIEHLQRELALVNDTLVQRTKTMHRALDRADAADARLARPRHCRACGHNVTVEP